MFVNKSVNISLLFLVVGIISCFFSDFSISTLDPFLETNKFFSALLDINFNNTEYILDAVLQTISIAVISIFISSIIGFVFAIFFKSFLLRITLAFTRSIHEIFWALIFLQIFGLNTLSALLAIIIPYSAILGKVYAEILEENDSFPEQLRGQNKVSYFLYTLVPDAFPHLVAYTLYRFECALRSTAILGFVGITTLGYYLSSFFMQGYYSDVWMILILFYIIVATIRYWFNKYTFIPVVIASFFYQESWGEFSLDNLIRFITSDIVPAPFKYDYSYDKSITWFTNLFSNEIVPGVFNTILVTQVSLIFTAFFALLFFPIVSNKFTKVPFLGHIFLVILRSTPEYILAYIFLQLFGPSMLPAVLALMLHNGAIISFLIGKQSDELVFERNTTSKRIELYFYYVLPKLYSQMLAFLFYRWEIIMRESAILGILGVATLGFFIDSAIADFRLDKMFLLLLVTAFLNIAIDIISKKSRDYLKVDKPTSSCGCSLK
jgi:phosphonate transport system permease protein